MDIYLLLFSIAFLIKTVINKSNHSVGDVYFRILHCLFWVAVICYRYSLNGLMTRDLLYIMALYSILILFEYIMTALRKKPPGERTSVSTS